MTTISSTVDTTLAVPIGFWTRARKTGAVLVALGLLASIYFTLSSPSQAATFYIGESTRSGSHFGVNGQVGSLVLGLIALAAGVALLVTGKRFGLWVSVSLA